MVRFGENGGKFGYDYENVENVLKIEKYPRKT